MKPEGAPASTTDEEEDPDVVDTLLPKLSSFEPMADTPEIYTVIVEKLWDSVLDVRTPRGREQQIAYRDLYRIVIAEGLLTSDFSAFAEVTTKAGSYRGNSNIWRLFCLECHCQLKRGHREEHSGGFPRAVWLLYETDSFVGDALGPHESFFVTIDGEIIAERFGISGDIPGPPFYGSEVLVAAGIWEESSPLSTKDDDLPHWSNERAWWIGGLRALYAQFYEGTTTGRACALAPGSRRLDELNFWVNSPAPDPAVEAMPRRIVTMAAKVDGLAAWLKLALFLGLALAIGSAVRTWFR